MLKWIRTALFQVKLSILVLTCFSACSQDAAENILFEQTGYNFPYQLARPGQSWKLPAELAEVSGLSFVDDQRLACVQDEKGIIYIFNLKTAEVESEVVFGEDGDYEDIEIIDNEAWILKSNGTLYKAADYLEKEEIHVKKYSTALSGKNDTEGLAYDPVNKSLLIACKGYPFVEENNGSGIKAIFSFSIELNQLAMMPFLLINLDTIRQYKYANALNRMTGEAMALFDPAKGDQVFQPSGLAIHPKSGDLFILGSVGKLLVVLSGKGELLAIINLNPKIFRQPEGICFSPEGVMYIASEGGGQEGVILKFVPDK
jgi:uncharacterized protein YjiK